MKVKYGDYIIKRVNYMIKSLKNKRKHSKKRKNMKKILIFTLLLVTSLSFSFTVSHGASGGSITDILTDTCTFGTNPYTSGQVGTICKMATTGYYYTVIKVAGDYTTDANIVMWVVYYNDDTAVNGHKVLFADRELDPYIVIDPIQMGLDPGDYNYISIIYSTIGATYQQPTSAYYWTYLYHSARLTDIIKKVQGEYIGSYDTGYLTGQDNFHDNGSVVYGYTLSTSFDYIAGVDTDLQTGAINFYNGFESWIVPAIILVMVVGGYFSMVAMKKKD